MAGFMKKNRKRTKTKAKRKSARRRIPGTSYFRTAGGRVQNSKGKFVKATSVKRGSGKKKRRRAVYANPPTRGYRKLRRNRDLAPGEGSFYAYERPSDGPMHGPELPPAKKRRKSSAKKTKGKRKGRKTTAKRTTKRRTIRRSKGIIAPKRVKGQKRRGKVRVYKRAKLRQASTGKTRLSYMYKKGRKYKRIPTKALIAAGYSPERIAKGRERAAARLIKSGSAFVANKGKSAKAKRSGRRLAAFNAARKAGRNKTKAKAAAIKKVPLLDGDTFMGATKKSKTKRRRRKSRTVRGRTARGRKTVGRRKKTTSRRRKTTGRRKTSGRRKSSSRKTTRKKRKSSGRKKSTTKKRRRSSKRGYSKKRSRKTGRKKTRRTSAKRRKGGRKRMKRNGVRRRWRSSGVSGGIRVNGRRRRKMRRNGRTYRRNNFMANMKAVLVSGLFAFGGYIAHRLGTNAVLNYLVKDTMADNVMFQTWKKPIVGAVLVAAGVPLVGKVAPKRSIEIGAGMVASLLQSVVVSALTQFNQPELITHVSGYENSRAYDLRGTGRRRRRGLRGIDQSSILPRYTPIGNYSQAAAGYLQAAAGTGEYFTAGANGTGEYFTAAATGEYFANAGMKGVGSYEPAGELVMQAAAGSANTEWRDGIRPDSDLDRELDLAEAAAGVGDWSERRVGQHSEWIPNGPLWAGERKVTDGQQTSELAAGILRVPGGNGILSGG